jgi:hypothetical protein
MIKVGDIVQKSRQYLQIVKLRYSQAQVLFFEFIAYMKSSRSDVVYAAFGYVPFIGWLVPLYIRDKSEICQKSGRQGFLLSIFAACVLLGFFFLELFIPSGFKIAMFVLIVLTYIFNVCYLTLSAFAMYHTAYGKVIRIPWISDTSDKLCL